MKTIGFNFGRFVVALLCFSTLGCTAAAMRVDIEVYKGPLSREPEVQWGEFVGLVNELADSLTSFNDATLALGVYEGYLKPDQLLVHTPSFRKLLEKDPSFFGTRVVIEDIPKEPDSAEVQKKNWCRKVPLVESWLPWPGVWNPIPDKYVGCMILAQLHDDAALVIGLINALRAELNDHHAGQSAQLVRRALSIYDDLSTELQQLAGQVPIEQEADKRKSLANLKLNIILFQLVQHLDQLEAKRGQMKDIASSLERELQASSGKPEVAKLFSRAMTGLREFQHQNDDVSAKIRTVADALYDCMDKVSSCGTVLRNKLEALREKTDSLEKALNATRDKAEALKATLLPGDRLPTLVGSLLPFLNGAKENLKLVPATWPTDDDNLKALRKKVAHADRSVSDDAFPPNLKDFLSDFGMHQKFIQKLKTLRLQVESPKPNRKQLTIDLDDTIRAIDETLQNLELLQVPWRQASNLARLAQGHKSQEDKRRLLQKGSEIAMQLKVKAFYWSGSHIASNPAKRTVRVSVANFANLASEYSNQLSARADALLKQMNGHDRNELPLNVHLRDAATTDFTNMYVWNRAVNLPLIEDAIYHPFRAFSSKETTDRVRGFERLFANYNWSHINTVYASGQGTTAMALIKDDIGNWNLKSFENDPSDLLKAYTDLTRAAVETAMSAVMNGFTGGGHTAAQAGIEAVVNRASRFASGQFGSAPGEFNLPVETLHKTASKRLKQLEKNSKTSQETIQSIRQILKEHSAIIEALHHSAAEQGQDETK